MHVRTKLEISENCDIDKFLYRYANTYWGVWLLFESLIARYSLIRRMAREECLEQVRTTFQAIKQQGRS